MSFSRKLLLLAGCLILSFAVGLVAWKSLSHSAMDVAKLRALLSEKNVALGYLESEQPEKTFPSWLQLTEAFPDEKLGPQNQVVAHLMSLQNAGGQPNAEVLEKLSAGMDRLQHLESQSAETFSLLARVQLARGDLAAALTSWKKAAELDSSNAAIWFEAYQAAKEGGPEYVDASSEFLNNAAKLAPDNLAVLLEQMPALVSEESPQIADVLDRAKEVFSPLEASVQRLVGVSLDDMLAQASDASRQGNWAVIRRTVQMIRNATRAEEAVQSDRLMVERSPLEFVVTDFSPEFYVKYAAALATTSPRIEVKYVPGKKIEIDSGGKVKDLELVDFDLNGTMDLVLLKQDAIEIYLKHESGDGYAPPVRLEISGDYAKVLAVDLDGDIEIAGGEVRQAGDFDLVLYGASGVSIIENQGGNQPQLTVITQEHATPDVHIVVPADLDHDGDLDLFIGTSGTPTVWSNVDGLHFEPWVVEAISGFEGNAKLVQAIAVDWDRDMDLDIIALYEGSPGLGYFENLRHRRMRWQSLSKDIAGIEHAKMFDIIDVDSNASWDILYADKDTLNVAQTRTVETGQVIPLSTKSTDASLPLQWQLLDYDNDGYQDLFAFDEGGSQLLRGEPDGRMEQTSSTLPKLEAEIIAAKQADLDGDGDLDLVLLTSDAIFPLMNEGGNQNHWIDVQLLAAQVKGGAASPSGRVNQYGLGSLLELRIDANYQAQVVRQGVTHFGLGDRKQADAIRVIWTNGIPQSIIQPEINTLITERQTLKGSCPYLYTWNGEKFEFVTDLLWAAPIGLQSAEGKIVPDRPWEYIKVPGEMLSQQNGKYEIRITEELWEAAYFDHVQLLAIDHPANVEVYTNEKVGPPSIAQHKLYAVEKKIWPKLALDTHGRDVSQLLSKQDDQYLKSFKKKILQGVTEPHFIELEFEDLGDAEQITLFLTGWIYPSDTSINVGLAENDSIAPPRPPFIESLDDEGQWVETIPFTGFPGGKTKTIAIDITNAFASDRYRLRVGTSNEIYWDAAFVTTSSPNVEVREIPLKLSDAKLAYRGFSECLIHPAFGPERYDYTKLSTRPKWPAMSGNYTRYGDVLPLLEEVDDQLVVIGSGDEISLSFDVPDQPLPPGWKRDFVLHSVGWDKDADLNTIYGTSSEPLPYQAMGSYPAKEYPADGAYQEYLRQYQTRRQSSAPFRRSWSQPSKNSFAN